MEEPGWDEVKKYFRKILNSFALGFFWMLAAFTAGLKFRLAYIEARVQWANAVFYIVLLLSFVGLVWWYYRMWKK